MKISIIILAALNIASCMALQDAAIEEFKYSFSEGICSTGEHTFATKTQMCASLQNNSFNDGCALIQRQNYFYTQCSGSFTPS